MPNGTRDMPGGPGQLPAGAPPLPDLSCVGLRFLREQEDPTLSVAVDHVLRCAEDFTESWWGEGGQGGKVAVCEPKAPTGT